MHIIFSFKNQIERAYNSPNWIARASPERPRRIYSYTPSSSRVGNSFWSKYQKQEDEIITLKVQKISR